jgi:hypothetical protein
MSRLLGCLGCAGRNSAVVTLRTFSRLRRVTGKGMIIKGGRCEPPGSARCPWPRLVLHVRFALPLEIANEDNRRHG